MSQQQAQTATSDRRIVRRRPLKKGVELAIRKGTTGLGPNLAAGGVELSHDGIQVKLKAELKKGDEVEIGLVGIGRGKAMTMIADIRWCRADVEGDVYLAGIRFRRRLTHAEIGLYV
jgi:hypothetical protein